MKGVELPINVLVIVAIAVIVLLGLVVLYFIGFNPFSGSISLTSLKNAGCSNFTLNYDCGRRTVTSTTGIFLPANNYNLNPNTLFELCRLYLGTDPSDDTKAEAQCREICGCL